MSDNELTITVQDAKNVVARHSDGAQATCDIRLDELRAATIGVLEGWLRKSASVSRTELEVLGSHLFESLFDGDVRNLLINRLGEASVEQPLRLLLVFEDKARELAQYSWEYLFLREGGGRAFFLSTYTKLVLSRLMPSLRARKPLSDGEALRILMAVSEPEDKNLGPVAAGPVIEAVQKVVSELREGFRLSERETLTKCDVEVEIIEKTTAKELISRIESIRPHVVHLIGHGRFDRATGSGAIALLQESALALGLRTVDWVSDTDFKELVLNLAVDQPALVFLHMCQGGEVDFERNFAGVAPQLITAGVQAVVAMQHPISNVAAIKFAQAFYKRIGSGKPIDHAVQFGRNEVSADRNLVSTFAFGTPVLYMHASDGIILPRREIRAAESSAPVIPLAGGAPQRTKSAPSAAADTDLTAKAPQESGNVLLHRVEPPAAAGGGGNVLQFSAQQIDPAGDTLRRMRKVGRVAAARNGLLDSAFAKQIDDIAAAASIALARSALDRLIEDPDDTLLPVWSEMMKVLNEAG